MPTNHLETDRREITVFPRMRESLIVALQASGVEWVALPRRAFFLDYFPLRSGAGHIARIREERGFFCELSWGGDNPYSLHGGVINGDKKDERTIRFRRLQKFIVNSGSRGLENVVAVGILEDNSERPFQIILKSKGRINAGYLRGGDDGGKRE